MRLTPEEREWLARYEWFAVTECSRCGVGPNHSTESWDTPEPAEEMARQWTAYDAEYEMWERLGVPAEVVDAIMSPIKGPDEGVPLTELEAEGPDDGEPIE
jgi:hypothetical protein